MNRFLLVRLAFFSWCAVIATLPLSLHAQQILNGGFELSPASSTVPSAGLGWTSTIQNQCYVLSYGAQNGAYGSQYLYVSTGGVSQTISGQFTVGMPYEISFAARDTMNGTAPNIGISLSGGVSAGQTFAMPRGGPYNTYTFDFTPTSTAPITMAFGGSYPFAMDNVTLVPEPSTWVLLGVGAVILGVSVYRRRVTS